MQLLFDQSLGDKYKSKSQKIRVMSEGWVRNQIFCPNCGQTSVEKYNNNKPVADFFCDHCHEDYELKSKSKSLGNVVNDGAYKTMVKRLRSSRNPNFFLLTYGKEFDVTNFIVIPKHFFVPEIIMKRKPLMPGADRAGWVGCNIDLRSIPESGKIFYVKLGNLLPKEAVRDSWQRTLFLREETDLINKSWTVDVMNCIERIGKRDFTLADAYAFERELRGRHPNNRHIKDKIRQQLQVLRDKGYLEFTSRGQYRFV